VGLFSVYYFRDSAAVRIMYTLITSAARSFFTLLSLYAAVGDIDLVYIFKVILIPEFLANICFAFLPHIAAILFFKPFKHSIKEE
ncbi:MAG: hypothetical protein IKI93_06850, partial [Clostridia bacterium]|nr:hypothetical protein [Clostridia bacterium]